MKILGIAALSHDASVAVINDKEILFAAHAERYSRIKNDCNLNAEIIDEACSFGEPDLIAWYERPFLKKTRHLFAGQWKHAFDLSDLPSKNLKKLGLGHIPVKYISHHNSHAAAGFLTSHFNDAAVLVVDAIGEWSTLSIGYYDEFGINWKRHSNYPSSLGLLYSAFTHDIGLKPNEEEYILMGMAAYGEPCLKQSIMDEFVDIDACGIFKLKRNVHRGIGGWGKDKKKEDIAASIQAVTEEVLITQLAWIADNIPSKNLVFMGGVALNCVANSKLVELWRKINGGDGEVWIMPNPGDAGSSLGAAAYVLGKKLHWQSAYLGTDIDHELDVTEAVKQLAMGNVIGVAKGRAEFGPRALGNRSVICDPRGSNMKDRVNEYKKRDKFRPFAPIILEEHAHRYFSMPVDKSPYMQYTAPCLKPDDYPAIAHVDGSARVQTLTKEQNPVFHNLLSKFYEKTGCPMLLNTSMNIKGEPLVNSWADALRFSKKTGIQVF